MKTLFQITLVCIGFIFFSGCEKDKMEEPGTYTIPSTYNFANVSYSGQTQRMGMLTELKSYIKSANTSGTTLDAGRLLAMYMNGADANWAGTYEASKKIRSKTFEPVQTVFDQLLVEVANASESTVAGSNGVAGVVVSSNGAKNYLLNEEGVELGQVIEKGLMGALLYYQSTGVYFEDGKMNVDNETVIAGSGTEMEHSWDEAFGYFGVPIDFPTNTDGLVFWGDYCNDRNAILGSNKAVMDAFLKGRAAISNKDIITRDEAITEAKNAWELVIVGTALHYLNSGQNNFGDMALRAHALSEAIAFIYSLQFNPDKKITNMQVGELLTLVGGSDNLLQANFYNADAAKILDARNQLAEWYNLSDKQDEF